MEIAIIGAGPAGVAAAVQCARLGTSPWLCDKTGTSGGLVKNAFCVENYPGLEPMDGPAFAWLLGAHLERFGVSVEGAAIQSVTPGDDGFLLEGDFGKIHARSVIAAVGTEAKRLDIRGAAELEGRGLYYEIATPPLGFPHARGEPEGGNQFVKETIVIGGGEAALDYALSLARNGSAVKILVRKKVLSASGKLVELVRDSDSIEILFELTPRFIGRSQKVVKVALDGPEGEISLAADAVVAAVGRRSGISGLINNLDESSARTLSTSIPGLFIAGDARTGTLGQVGMAVGDGLDAAMRAVSYTKTGA